MVVLMLSYSIRVMDPNSSLGEIFLGENIVEISSDKVEGSGDWNSPEFQDTANSGGKKETKAMVFHQMDAEEVSDRFVALCFANGVEAYDGEINIRVEENMISNEYVVKLCLEHEIARKSRVLIDDVDTASGVPRVGIPRPPRASMQDLYGRMGRMEIRQEAIERVEYRQSYHWDRGDKGHMSKQCTKPKRKRDNSWFKDKVLLVQVQANCQILYKEELAFLADLGIAEAKVALMANLLHYGSDALIKVHNHDNVDNNIINQGVQEAVQNSNSSAQQDLEHSLYDGNVIKENTSAIVIRDSEETLMLAEESHSKMLLKQHDPMVLEKKVNTTPVDYVVLNQFLTILKNDCSTKNYLLKKQAFASQNSMNSSDPSPSCRPTKVKVLKSAW
ncbi:hypothetical protein Tco_0594990 [Tanacetum coccineum]